MHLGEFWTIRGALTPKRTRTTQPPLDERPYYGKLVPRYLNSPDGEDRS